MDAVHFKDTPKSEKALPVSNNLAYLPDGRDIAATMGQGQSHYVRIQNNDDRLLARLGYFQVLTIAHD